MDKNSLSGAKRRLVDHLKRHGERTAVQIAQALSLTSVAVRQHLQVLQEGGWVSPRPCEPQGRGRPSVRWRLTGQATRLYGDTHGELLVDLLDAAKEHFGQEGLDRLLASRAESQVERYRKIVGKEKEIVPRLEALAQLRTDEGYMAEVMDQGDGDCILVEHHCPICEAAAACRGLCAMELEVFQRSLGEDVTIERTRHLLENDDRCAYRIRPRSETSED